MKTIAFWARRNVLLARSLLIVGYTSLIGAALYLGFLSFLEDIIISQKTSLFFFSVLLIAIFFYPRKKAGSSFGHSFFYRKKLSDWAITTAVFFLVFTHTNRALHRWIPGTAGQEGQARLTYWPEAELKKSLRAQKKWERKQRRMERKKRKAEKRRWIKELKSQLKSWKKQRKLMKKQNSGDDLLFVLYISAMIGVLILFIGLLVCALSCSGLGIAAAIVGLGGLGLAMVLLVIGIRSRFGKS